MKSVSSVRLGTALLILGLLGLPAPVAGAAEPERVRVYASAQQKVVSFDELVAALAAEADVVFVGEQHDDPATHRIELALLRALQAKRPRVALSLEMFERDTQTAVDAYLAGAMTEEAFLGQARPWKNYATDYRPLVEFARANKLPVIASNVPRRLSSKVATGKGLAELAAFPTSDAQWVAAEVHAPRDRYWFRFRETMQGHAGADEGAMYSYYMAQVVKDETMAESIARFWIRTSVDRPLVVHYNGAFHSDFGEGTALRVRRRAPAAATAIVTIIPVDDPEKADGAAESGRADFVVFCAREPKPAPGA